MSQSIKPERPVGDSMLVGIDTGGTFTDVVLWANGRLQHRKVLSTPDDPSRAVLEGLRLFGLETATLRMVHGTTVGTNAVLEGKGARVAYVTSKGFADVLTLGRQNREEVYRLEQPAQDPPVPQSLCFEVSSRPDASGQLLNSADDEELKELRATLESRGVESVAINLLFSFLCQEEEQRIAHALPGDLFISRSSQVLPEVREFERGMATWLNASIGPVMDSYLETLTQTLPRAVISVMQSSGTTVAANQAAAQSVRLLLSGPAGGVSAALLLSKLTGRKRFLTLDMGGTSTDVSLIEGRIPLTSQSAINRWPLTVPTVDIHTIGAGGGSLARADAAGMLLVGPESAGANPGPACYGQGGQSVTVTDANLVLGRIPASTRLGGYLPLDMEASKLAMTELGSALGLDARETARGVIQLANEHMARALRVISVERGRDPREHGLLCFGGAGGLHACDLAELLDMSSIVVPALSGVFSAFGLLAAQPGRELSHAVLKDLSTISQGQIDAEFDALEQKASSELRSEGADTAELRYERRIELRYRGQSAGLVVDAGTITELKEAFEQAHEQASGHRLDRPVELVNLRLSARAPAALTAVGDSGSSPDLPLEGDCWSQVEGVVQPVPVIARDHLPRGEALPGPAIITDLAATVWVGPHWKAEVDDWNNLVLNRVS